MSAGWRDHATEALHAIRGDALLAALSRGRRPGERPEELLLDLGLVSSRDYALELALRTHTAYLGLRGFLLDERLLLYVPLALAIEQRVCPLLIVGDSLKLASAYLDPDLSLVRERFPQLELELVLSPRDEILEVLSDASYAAR